MSVGVMGHRRRVRRYILRGRATLVSSIRSYCRLVTEATHPATDDDDALERIPYVELAARGQVSPVPPPLSNPPLLPFHQLDPEVLERVVAETIWRRDHQSAHFYGRRGQKQHGLDIVEHEHKGSRSLYQVKRYQKVDATQLRDAVEEYAGKPRKPGHALPPRRFDPRRFVVVTSATIDDDTNNVDEVATLRTDYAGDLEIDAWGAEQLSRLLRDSPGLVAAVFGPAWAAAFCGTTPREPGPQEPRPLALVEDPVEVLGLSTVVADAQAVGQNDPAQAAALYARVATELDEAAFPGHAALIRRQQAEAARAAGDRPTAFDLEFAILLDRVAGGEAIWIPSETGLAADAEALGGVRHDKWLLLSAASTWPEEMIELDAVAEVTTRLASSVDGDVPLLCCMALEQAIIDGLFAFDPPQRIVVDVNLGRDVDARLAAIVDAARLVVVTARDVAVRARLRCAIADAALRANSRSPDVDAAYRDLVADAGAGRFRDAGGLVASRAAYAFYTHGDADRAETLWRQSAMASGEAGLYGDVREVLLGIREARRSVGQYLRGLETVLQALPNRRRLLDLRVDPAPSALEAAQDDRLIEGFGAARRWLARARLSGHFVDEMIAWQQFSRVLSAAEHRAGAVECLVLAGQSDLAGNAARLLTNLADTWRWTVSGDRARQAAAVRVAAEQSSLQPDDTVSQRVTQLLELAQPLWTTRASNANPQMEAIKAIARFGHRIPAPAVDGILDLAAPAIERATGADEQIANLLVQTYWAVIERRDDLADAIAAMLRRTQPPHNLWGLIENIPASARDPLLPTVTDLADAGDQSAVAALASWRHAPADVQLRARRAVASLLRRPVGHDRQSWSLGGQEDSVVRLVVALLEGEDEVPVASADLAKAQRPPTGRVVAKRSVTTDQRDDSADGRNRDDPDQAAQLAAAPRDDVAVAVAVKLLDLAEDRKDIAGSRQGVVAALIVLLPHLPGHAAAEAARRLAVLHQDPGLSDDDLHEIETNTPLSRTRIDMGAAWLAPYALVAAAEALRRAGVTDDPLSDDDAFAERLVAAALPLLVDGKPGAATLGARAVMAVAASRPHRGPYATSLLLHPDPDVRATGALDGNLSDHFVERLAADPAPRVRMAIASRGASLPGHIRDLLASDPNAVVRHVLRRSED